MEKNVADDITYYLVIDAMHKTDLANIRPWHNLKVGIEENRIWVKDFDYAQVNSLEVKSIPYKTIYYSKNGKLFLLNSQLQDRNIPNVLWTPIERALPVKLPAFNHNYFGISEKLTIHIVESEKEAESVAMITDLNTLETYLNAAPTIRLKTIKWVILDEDKVFLWGTPLLPINGKIYWQQNDLIIPGGYDLDLHLVAGSINDLINPDRKYLVVWDKDSRYFLIDKKDLQPLSLSSFRASIQQVSFS